MAKNGVSFSMRYTQVGEKKKFKAHILKFVGPILKFLRHIFAPVAEYAGENRQTCTQKSVS